MRKHLFFGNHYTTVTLVKLGNTSQQNDYIMYSYAKKHQWDVSHLEFLWIMPHSRNYLDGVKN